MKWKTVNALIDDKDIPVKARPIARMFALAGIRTQVKGEVMRLFRPDADRLRRKHGGCDFADAMMIEIESDPEKSAAWDSELFNWLEYGGEKHVH